jgi:putative transposase
VEEALEAEVNERLGPSYYERRGQESYRNGYRCGRLKTAEGVVQHAVPQITQTNEPWRSETCRAHLPDHATAGAIEYS